MGRVRSIASKELISKFELWQKLHPEWRLKGRCKYCKLKDVAEYDFITKKFQCNPIHVDKKSGCLKFLLKEYYQKHD